MTNYFIKKMSTIWIITGFYQHYRNVVVDDFTKFSYLIIVYTNEVCYKQGKVDFSN